ncbi:MAG: class II aldolase/adducin family protein [Candidatus Aminicenantes bacterium]|nr:MAG: class II aldolase/adducin family protein [Candidatus Aminicenantes bacterium]RPJ02230.1 MAG: class II aldolase/adducin family protein [Candidatus Aminicenantes bacterium]
MLFALIKNDSNPERDALAAAIVASCLEHGHTLGSPEDGVRFVLNLTDVGSPRSFRRRAQSVFVFSLVTLDRPPDPGTDLRSLCYTTLVRTLSNVLLCAVPRDGQAGNGGGHSYEMYFTTPEAGFYHLEFDPERVYERIIPIAGSRFAIANRISEDLPERFWRTSPVVERIKAGGGELDALGVLPAPFCLRDVLPERSIRHIYKLFEMRSLSYGNLSARERIPELGETTFWMTARGVDKAHLSKIGWDVLLVKGFDADAVQALVSVPPDHDPKARVSVDAVEHELIYRTFPGVEAIVHIHAWMDGVLSTGQNYPCGTIELAEDVVRLLARTARPERTSVGLRNHGLTITGPSLDEIFGRIRGQLRTEVQMTA